MNKEFVSYEIALQLKELGFDEPCFGFYDPTLSRNPILNGDCINPKPTLFNHNSYIVVVSAPLWQQAFDWFREKYGLDVNYDVWTPLSYVPTLHYCNEESLNYKCRAGSKFFGRRVFDCKKEAIKTSLEKLIEIVKEKIG